MDEEGEVILMSVENLDGLVHFEQQQDNSSSTSTNTGSTTIAVEPRKCESLDDITDAKSPDENSNGESSNVWSPSGQRRTLRLDFSHIKDSEESVPSPKNCSPVLTSQLDATATSQERNQPSPHVWQPFGEPVDTPHFRSVKIEKSSKRHKKSSSSTPTTPKKVDPEIEESKEDESQKSDIPISISTINGSPDESNVTSTTTTTTLFRTGRTCNLPPSQSPTVTLLQKAREGQLPKGAIYIDEKPDSSGPLLPKNAVLIDQKVTIEGDKVHTDSYYAVPGPSSTDEVTTQLIKAPPKYDGIGPTEYGIPVGLRTGVKDEYGSDWYKTMYRSLHRGHGDSHGLGHMQAIHLGGYMSEPEFERKVDYRSSRTSTLDYRPKAEKTVTIKETLAEPIARPVEERIKSPVASSREYVFEVAASGKDAEPPYKNQPRSIADYEPGRSSLADREFQKFWDDFWESLDDLHEHFRHSPRPQRSYEKKWPNAILCDGYESDSTIIRKNVRPASRPDPEQQKAWYKEIQKGGEIPFTGLRKLAPAKPKDSPHQYQETEVNIHYKSPIRNLEKEYIEEEELRKRQEETMKRFYVEEREKKQQQQAAEIEMRRHSDNFTPSQKSPIPLNRYDNPFEVAYSSMRLSPYDTQRTLAQVLYPFVAQSTRELSLSKDDIVYINRQIDRNWYEGEHHGFVGIFPVSYVTVIPTERANFHPKEINEGYAVVKYNFRAKTPMELSLFKGEKVILTRRVDPNWFEGRLGTKKGIFPASYVEVLQQISGTGYTLDRTLATSPRSPVSPIHSSTVINGPVSKFNTGTTTITRNYQNKLSTEKSIVSHSLHVDTYNEPIPYRSIYSYRPQNDDELELYEGDTVYVMEKCDDGWYVGTSLRTGLFGTFPGNYVERI